VVRRYGWLAGLALILGLGWFFFDPPRFWLNLTKQVEPTPETGAQLVVQYDCRSCHQIGGAGALKAPNLNGITQRVADPAQVTLRLWLQNPRAVKGNTAMPNFHLSDSEIEAILVYLAQLDSQGQTR
jgi:mono/diheme cytochrome c family protein